MTCSSQEVAGAIRQLIVEIDCRLIQNPAYGLLILINKSAVSFILAAFFILYGFYTSSVRLRVPPSPKGEARVKTTRV